jgi:DNA adenine methylase
MSAPPLVPPIKCQGIKTKLVEEIRQLVKNRKFARWVEPFCGSCVVPLNLQPPNALLCDSNKHIVNFYRDIQQRKIGGASVREFLRDQGAALRSKGEDYYYEVRDRFNASPSSLDFLFLNRSCFNGVMRFNQKGRFNVPFCRKPDRFAAAYITKISNQVSAISLVISQMEWEFRVSGFKETLSEVTESDLVYADPPYAGRHVDYFNSWSEQDEDYLGRKLANLPSGFVLSTWHSNEFRSNAAMEKKWYGGSFHIFTKKHFYHVGSTEDLRHPMIEALITNFPTERDAAGQAPLQISLPLCELLDQGLDSALEA